MEHKTRYAGPEDVALILGFIKALAEYEHMSDEVVADEETLREWIFEMAGDTLKGFAEGED